jgi:hypothetical protein
MVGDADFGRDAITKAKGVLEAAQTALERRHTGKIKEEIERLERTERMFKGVVSRSR